MYYTIIILIKFIAWTSDIKYDNSPRRLQLFCFIDLTPSYHLPDVAYVICVTEQVSDFQRSMYQVTGPLL